MEKVDVRSDLQSRLAVCWMSDGDKGQKRHDEEEPLRGTADKETFNCSSTSDILGKR